MPNFVAELYLLPQPRAQGKKDNQSPLIIAEEDVVVDEN